MPLSPITSATVLSSPLTASPPKQGELATATGAGNIGDLPQPMPDIAPLSTEGSEEAQAMAERHAKFYQPVSALLAEGGAFSHKYFSGSFGHEILTKSQSSDGTTSLSDSLSQRDKMILLCMLEHASQPEGSLSQACRDGIESLTDFNNVENFHELIKAYNKFNFFHFISLEKLPEVFALILKRANEAGIKDAFMHLIKALSTGHTNYLGEYSELYPQYFNNFRRDNTDTLRTRAVSPF
ncbi:hypothetical protein [Candidatus Regiella endosymbiont of Tuberolachnus salignus]|uniref:hypothetical protein n=1 Tax=Candidatus Regiella endosymbiont of Tuberolachnus salignus TaxID=3077956 RepID=UPI0030CAECEB